MKTYLLIDGQNVKGSIKQVFAEAGKPSPVWEEYDFSGLFDRVLTGKEATDRCFYFARIEEHKETLEKSKKLVEKLRRLRNHLVDRQDFRVVFAGRVRGREERNRFGKVRLTFREKGVDVRIAVDMVSLACDKKADHILLTTSDSDLHPAIDEAKRRGVRVTYIGFENNPNRGLRANAGHTILIRDSEVLEFEHVFRTLMRKSPLQ